MRIAAIGLGVLVVALGSGAALAAGGGGGGAPSGGSFNMPERQMTPEEQAKAAYNQGVRAVKAADKLAKSADEATDEKKKTKGKKGKAEPEADDSAPPTPAWSGVIVADELAYLLRAFEKQGKSGPYFTLTFEKTEKPTDEVEWVDAEPTP